MRIAVIAALSARDEKGGAENFYEGLAQALNAAGITADLVGVTSDESSFDAIQETLLRFYDLDLSSYEGVISTKAPGFLVRHKNHVCYLVHTIRIFYDMFSDEFKHPTQAQLEQRALILKLDALALSPPRTKRVYTIGNEVRQRLVRYLGIEPEVIHPPLSQAFGKSGRYDYVFLPGRLHRWKRVDLVIRAMEHVNAPLNLIISGEGEDGAYLRSIAASNSRVVFVGRVPEEELIELYANALCVPFVPIREDYGYVTVEAFRCSKPVITCIDSGEPTSMVCHGKTGFICQPNPKNIACRINYFHSHPEKARQMGEQGKASISPSSWDRVARILIASLS